MSESLNDLSELEFLVKNLNVAKRHYSNLENTSSMMRNGQFIDAYSRVLGTKEGLSFMIQAIESRILSLTSSKKEPTKE